MPSESRKDGFPISQPQMALASIRPLFGDHAKMPDSAAGSSVHHHGVLTAHPGNLKETDGAADADAEHGQEAAARMTGEAAHGIGGGDRIHVRIAEMGSRRLVIQAGQREATSAVAEIAMRPMRMSIGASRGKI